MASVAELKKSLFAEIAKVENRAKVLCGAAVMALDIFPQFLLRFLGVKPRGVLNFINLLVNIVIAVHRRRPTIALACGRENGTMGPA